MDITWLDLLVLAAMLIVNLVVLSKEMKQMMGSKVRTTVKHDVLSLGCLVILLFIPRGYNADPRWLPHSHLIALSHISRSFFTASQRSWRQSFLCQRALKCQSQVVRVSLNLQHESHFEQSNFICHPSLIPFVQAKFCISSKETTIPPMLTTMRLPDIKSLNSEVCPVIQSQFIREPKHPRS
jgi:hypothetical protein